MGIDSVNVYNPVSKMLAVPHLSWVRKLSCDFAGGHTILFFCGGARKGELIWHSSTLPPNGWLLLGIIT